MCGTIPPSTSIDVRGGQVWSTFGEINTCPGATFDLADPAVTGRSPVFTTPYAYGYYWLAMYVDASRLRVGGGTTAYWEELLTAAEAEEAALANDCNQLHTLPPWDWGISIGCVILRNNGNVTEANQFQPIDQINRGQSYVFRTYNSLTSRNVM